MSRINNFWLFQFTKSFYIYIYISIFFVSFFFWAFTFSIFHFPIVFVWFYHDPGSRNPEKMLGVWDSSKNPGGGSSPNGMESEKKIEISLWDSIRNLLMHLQELGELWSIPKNPKSSCITSNLQTLQKIALASQWILENPRIRCSSDRNRNGTKNNAMQTGAETKPIIQLTTNKRSKNDPSIRIPENIPEAQIKKRNLKHDMMSSWWKSRWGENGERNIEMERCWNDTNIRGESQLISDVEEAHGDKRCLFPSAALYFKGLRPSKHLALPAGYFHFFYPSLSFFLSFRVLINIYL